MDGKYHQRDYWNYWKGKRVELHPATDQWMQGDRYGTVVGRGRLREYATDYGTDRVRPLRIKLDKSGRIVRQLESEVTEL